MTWVPPTPWQHPQGDGWDPTRDDTKSTLDEARGLLAELRREAVQLLAVAELADGRGEAAETRTRCLGRAKMRHGYTGGRDASLGLTHRLALPAPAVG